MAAPVSSEVSYIIQNRIHEVIEQSISQVLEKRPKNPLLSVAAFISASAHAAYSSETAEALRTIEAVKVLYPENLAMKYFDLAWWSDLSDVDQARMLQIVRSGYKNPDSQMGCYAMHPNDYDEFRPFFSKVLAGYHKVPESRVHQTSWEIPQGDGIPADGRLDLAALGLPPLSMRVRVGRNLKAYPLPGSMSQADRVKMEEEMCRAFKKLIEDPKYGGKYHSLTPGHPDHIDDKKYDELVKEHLMFKDMSKDSYLMTAGIASSWPFGRGCYVSADRGFIVWVGEEDHLRIMCMAKGTVLNDVFDRLKSALDTIESVGLDFAKTETFGYVTSCPTNMGTGMRASVHIQLPNLTKGEDGKERTDARAKAVAREFKLSVRGLGGEHTAVGDDGTVDISPSSRFCITESEIIVSLYRGLRSLKEQEDAEPHRKHL